MVAGSAARWSRCSRFRRTNPCRNTLPKDQGATAAGEPSGEYIFLLIDLFLLEISATFTLPGTIRNDLMEDKIASAHAILAPPLWSMVESIFLAIASFLGRSPLIYFHCSCASGHNQCEPRRGKGVKSEGYKPAFM